MKKEDKPLTTCPSDLIDVNSYFNEPIDILKRLAISAKERSQGCSRSVDEVFDKILVDENNGK